MGFFMSRFSTQPYYYASLADIQQALLVQIRRFRRAYAESAGVTVIGPAKGGGRGTGAAIPSEADAQLERLALLHDQIVLLKSMEGQLLSNSPGDPKAKAAGKQVATLIDDIDRRAKALHRAMSQTAQGAGIGTNVKSETALLVEALKKQLGKNAGAIKTSFLSGTVSSPAGEPTPADIAYVRISELKGADGYMHPHFFLMTAYPRTTKDAKGKDVAPMFVSTSPEFKVPKKIRWLGTAHKVTELVALMLHLLTEDGIICRSFTRDIPVDKKHINFAHDNIEKTTVVNNTILVKVKNVDELNATANALRDQLQSIVMQHDPKNRDVIRYKPNPSRGTVQFIFSLPGKLRGRLINKDKLTEIRKLLNLTNEEVQRMKTALEFGE